MLAASIIKVAVISEGEMVGVLLTGDGRSACSERMRLGRRVQQCVCVCVCVRARATRQDAIRRARFGELISAKRRATITSIK